MSAPAALASRSTCSRVRDRGSPSRTRGSGTPTAGLRGMRPSRTARVRTSARTRWPGGRWPTRGPRHSSSPDVCSSSRRRASTFRWKRRSCRRPATSRYRARQRVMPPSTSTDSIDSAMAGRSPWLALRVNEAGPPPVHSAPRGPTSFASRLDVDLALRSDLLTTKGVPRDLDAFRAGHERVTRHGPVPLSPMTTTRGERRAIGSPAGCGPPSPVPGDPRD